MIIHTELYGKSMRFDLNKAIDISMPLSADEDAASAWYVPPIKIEAVKTEQFVGDVNQGGSVNFNNISFNPHGNGTHTESYGHLSADMLANVNTLLSSFHFIAEK